MAEKTEMKKTHTQKNTTQRFLNISEIKEDTVILKSGGLRAVLMVSSMNFDLKSEEEQNSTIGAYVNFLNLLQYPIQIVVQSRKLDIDEYLRQVKAAEKKQLNELLRIQTAEYAKYVSELVQLADIMTKRYYVIVPFDQGAKDTVNFWGRLQKVFAPGANARLTKKQFADRMEQLEKRVAQVQTGIANIGLQVQRLDTQSLIELYYNTYNPVLSDSQRLPAVEKLEVDIKTQ